MPHRNAEEVCSTGRRGVLAGAGAVALGLALPGVRGAGAQTPSKSKVGVIGSGHIGGTVGELWVKSGHEVLFSSRHPDELKDMVARLGPLARAGTPEQAFAFGDTFGDAVLLAIPYKAYPQFGQEYATALRGKVVLDAGNATAARDGPLADEAKANGIGLTSAKYLPGAKLVRAFNTLNYKVLAEQANRSGDRLAIPIAGDDQAAVEVAAGLVRDAGFEPVIAGGLAKASEFQMGAPGYGQNVSAAELRQRLGLSR